MITGKRHLGGGLASVLLALGCREGAPPADGAEPRRQAAAALRAASDRESGPGAAQLALELVDDFNPPRPLRAGPAMASAAMTGAPSAAGGAEVVTPGGAAGSAGLPAAAWDAALGGLSGLSYSAADGVLYAVTDDRGRFPPRLYGFEVELSERALRVVPRVVVPLREPAPTDALVALDAEGLVAAGGVFFVSVEGNAEPPSQRESRIFELGRDGLVRGQLLVPPAFRPAPGAESARGTRPNLGFEGLSLSPSGRWLFASAESALFQDGDTATFDAGARVRLARWDLQQRGEPVEFFYRTEPVEPRLDAPSAALNGVSELVALDDERLLVLERAYVAAGERRVNTIRIFEVDLAGVTGAIAGSAEPPLLTKRLVLDLEDVVAGFDEGLRELDNFEGMALGPALPSGNPSLLLVSDDNFNATQRTVFVALELRRGRPAAAGPAPSRDGVAPPP